MSGTVILICTNILSNNGSNRRTDAVRGQCDQTIYLIPDTIGCHCLCTVFIYILTHKQETKLHGTASNSSRKSDTKNGFHFVFFKVNMFQVQMHQLILLIQRIKGNQGGGQLRRQGSQGSSCNIQIQHDHEQRIKNHIDQNTEQIQQHRAHRISLCLINGAENINCIQKRHIQNYNL